MMLKLVIVNGVHATPFHLLTRYPQQHLRTIATRARIAPSVAIVRSGRSRSKVSCNSMREEASADNAFQQDNEIKDTTIIFPNQSRLDFHLLTRCDVTAERNRRTCMTNMAHPTPKWSQGPRAGPCSPATMPTPALCAMGQMMPRSRYRGPGFFGRTL
jgi:hypothetical protein